MRRARARTPCYDVMMQFLRGYDSAMRLKEGKAMKIFSQAWLWKGSLILGCLLLSTTITSAAPRPAIGVKVDGARFNDIRYLSRTLDELVTRQGPHPTTGVVLVFSNTTCPLVQRYIPRLKEMSAEFGPRGIQFANVNVSPTESILDVATQGLEFDIPFPCVQDIEGSTVAACGVGRTPEVVLLDADLRLLYRGRIDDQYRVTGMRPQPTQTPLRDAIEALLAGEEITTPETTVDGCVITPPLKPTAADKTITFHQHVRPLIVKHCTYCHQPGTTAPFSLITYDDVVNSGEMIAEVVDQQRMPPWYASPKHGEFLNARTLSREERQTILGWVRAGMPEGDPANAEPEEETIASQMSDPDPEWGGQRWWIGKPDLVLTVPGEYEIPADGFVDYKYAVLPHLFLRDTWLVAAEVQPENPRIVHHANLGFLKIGADPREAKLITGYVPGVGPMELGNGIASRIPAGSAVGLQIHLTTTGKPEKTRLRVGFRFPREPVQQELRYLQLSNTRFVIPPYASHHPVSRTKGVDQDVTVFGFFSHMHLRGKASTFIARPPQGAAEILLMIPNYNFDWQLPYYLKPEGKQFPAGTQFECLSHFDNSEFNPFNPDPSVAVQEGQQTVQEMMYGFLFYTLDDEQLNLTINPRTGHVTSRKPAAE